MNKSLTAPERRSRTLADYIAFTDGGGAKLCHLVVKDWR